MSMDHDRREPNQPITEREGVMFAATPVWERNRKKRGFGARRAAPVATVPETTVAPEPRSFASERDYDEPMALDRPVDRPAGAWQDPTMTPYASPSAPEEHGIPEDGSLVAPIAQPSTRRNDRSGGNIAPAAIAAGVVTLGALGAAGWFMTRGDDGIPELAPGSPTVSEVATAPVTPTTPLPVEVAANEPPAPLIAAPRVPTRVAAPAPRVRPAAAAPSAGESGVNASATTALPDGPQPDSALNPGATPAPAAPPLTQTAPPPTETPAAIPATPPAVTPDPAPAPTPEPAAETPPPTS